MARLLLAACVIGVAAVREQQDLLSSLEEDVVDDESAGNKCQDLVPGSKPTWFSVFRARKCKCSRNYALKGSDKTACGDGTRTLFRKKTVKGKGCACMPLIDCPDLQTVSNFNLDGWISAPWYIQKQMEVDTLPVKGNNCVWAQYSKRDKKTWWGYTIKVDNHGEFDDGKKRGGELCAYKPRRNPESQLKVAPCALPRPASGPYWVIEYNETGGYGMVVAGQPSIKTTYGCRTGTGTFNAGFWIFTREAFPEDGLVDKVVKLAAARGMDVGVLNPIRHKGCTGEGYDA